MLTIGMGLVRPSAIALCIALLFSNAGFAGDTRADLAWANDDSFRPLVYQTTAHRARDGDFALNAASTSDAGVNVDVDVEPLLTASEFADASEWLEGSDAALAGDDGCCDPGDQPGLLGCLWHGGDAITAEYIYTGEVFSNTRGGLDTNDATAYTGRFDMVLSADLDKLCWRPGGRLFFHFQTLHGQGITDRYVGAHQRISNIDGNPGAGFNFAQLTQFWWERSIVEGLLTVRMGKILADSEFALATRGGDFINTSLGWTHTIPVLPAHPTASASLIAFLQLSEGLELKAGIWEGAPEVGGWGFNGSGDLFSICQLTAKYDLCDCQLPGDMHVGMWYHDGVFSDQAGGADHRGNHGIYWGMSQLLRKEISCDPCDSQGEQGLGMFAQFGWAPPERNVAENYWGLGLVYTGLLCCRDADTIGIGIGNMTFGDRSPSTGDETLIEIFYKARLGPHVVIQPDIQYFASPNGMQRDSLVLGLRFQTIF